mgnify:CR=1 FL=1
MKKLIKAARVILVLALLSGCLPFMGRTARAESTLYSSPGYLALEYLGYDSQSVLKEQGLTFDINYLGKPLKESDLWETVRPTYEGKTLDYTGSTMADCPGRWWTGSREDVYRLGGTNCALFVSYYVFGYLRDVTGRKFPGLPTEPSGNWFSVWKIHNTLTAYLSSGLVSRPVKTAGASYRSYDQSMAILADLQPGDIVLWSKLEGSYYGHASVYVGCENGNYIFAHSGVTGRGPELITAQALMGTGGPKGGLMRVQEVFRFTSGSLQIHKQIASNEMLCELAGYSLAGAQFEVRDEDGNLAGTLISDDKGDTGLLNLDPGIYSITEVKAPEGFRLPEDGSETQTVSVNDGEVTDVFFEDDPLFDPMVIFLRKNDAISGEPVAGAQFTVSVYPGVHFADVSAVTGQPERVWIFTTDEDGAINLITPGKCLVSGELYYDDDGTPVLLPGTYLIKETLIPAGYAACEDFLIYEDTPSGDLLMEAAGVQVSEGRQLMFAVAKVDTDGNNISGAHLQIWQGDQLVTEFISEEQDTDISAYLEPAVTYVLREVEAPEGYLVSADVEFTAIQQTLGEVIRIVMTDRREPSLSTKASYLLDQHTVTITDELAYENLVENVSYRAVGVLMDKATGQPLTDAQGNELISEVEFLGGESVTVSWQFDSLIANEKTIVVFERIYCGEEPVVAHEDWDDADQTVRYIIRAQTPRTGNFDILPYSTSLTGLCSAGFWLLLKKRRQD